MWNCQSNIGFRSLSIYPLNERFCKTLALSPHDVSGCHLPSEVFMRHDFLPFSQPSIGDDEIREVVETLRSNWLTTGPKTREFERLFAEYLETPNALSLNSCTAGLHTALITLGIGAGDEVITTPMTFAASVNVIEHVGARPVLVDVRPDTMNICPDAIAAAITPKTKAIIPVHLAGHPVDMDAIGALAQQHDLHIIEDAAHAISAKYKGQMIGSMGNPTAFSFYATKNIHDRRRRYVDR